jgi:hypothetical protein
MLGCITLDYLNGYFDIQRFAVCIGGGLFDYRFDMAGLLAYHFMGQDFGG